MGPIASEASTSPGKWSFTSTRETATNSAGTSASQPASTYRRTAFSVLGALSVCHLLNDMVQSLLPAIYPILKTALQLDFRHIGMITLVNQVTASLLQPAVGFYTDRRPRPQSLAAGMTFTLCGLVLLASAYDHSGSRSGPGRGPDRPSVAPSGSTTDP